jgi:hypothetical protein
MTQEPVLKKPIGNKIKHGSKRRFSAEEHRQVQALLESALSQTCPPSASEFARLAHRDIKTLQQRFREGIRQLADLRPSRRIPDAELAAIELGLDEAFRQEPRPSLRQFSLSVGRQATAISRYFPEKTNSLKQSYVSSIGRRFGGKGTL